MALHSLAVAFNHYNENHPHSALGYHSPREYRRLRAYKSCLEMVGQDKLISNCRIYILFSQLSLFFRSDATLSAHHFFAPYGYDIILFFFVQKEYHLVYCLYASPLGELIRFRIFHCKNWHFSFYKHGGTVLVKLVTLYLRRVLHS